MEIINHENDASPAAKDSALADGVYFNLREKEYHALQRLSASGINNILVSPATFWHKSWLNAEREDEDTPDRLLGRAYHTARLEPHRLDELFVSELDKEDYADGILTDTAVKAALKELGAPQSKAGERAIDRAHRLRSLGYEGKIWLLELEGWECKKGDRTPIPAQYWRDIQTDMRRLRGNPEIAELFSGGAAEVSILWTCRETGLKMKGRIDYIKPNMIVDLKTFQNSNGKRLDQAIADAFRYNRYYIQAALYWTAVELIRAGDLQSMDGNEEQSILFDQIASNPSPLASWYVFQEKGGVPNLLAYEIGLLKVHESAYAGESGIDDETIRQRARDAVTNKTALMLKAEMEIRHAKGQFSTYSEVYGDGEPWQPVTPLRSLNDEMFSGYWLDESI